MLQGIISKKNSLAVGLTDLQLFNNRQADIELITIRLEKLLIICLKEIIKLQKHKKIQIF